MEVYVIGSCRVYKPSHNLKVSRWGGGMIHTPRQIVQAIDISEKRIDIDKELIDSVFYTDAEITMEAYQRTDLNLYDKFIVELGSLTDFMTDNGIYCHSFQEHLTIPHTVVKYDLKTVVDCLNKIYDGFKRKPIIFVQHTNFKKINNTDRYMLGLALSSFAGKRKNVYYLDILNIIAEHGREKTLKDDNHHTDFLIDAIRSELRKFIEGV